MKSRARAILGSGLVLFLLLPAVLASAAEKGTSGKVDINSASQSELESLPGVGPALAKRIIENRPYSSASGLSKAGVPEATIDKLRGLVKAGRGSRAEAKEEKAVAKSEKRAEAEKSSGTKVERKAPESAPAGKVDLNTASQKELEGLPGVGAATAKKIIENRPYKSVADLSRAGVSASTVDKLGGMVRVSRGERAEKPKEKAAALPEKREPARESETSRPQPPAAGSRAASSPPAGGGRVDLNTASQAELEALPGIGPAYAKKIIANRPYSSASDLSKAGLPAGTIARVSGMVTTSRPQSRSSEGAAAAYQPPPSRGMVWVNLDTKVFHREGDRWYGRTVHGKYMTEAEAVRSGARVSHEKGEPEKP